MSPPKFEKIPVKLKSCQYKEKQKYCFIIQLSLLWIKKYYKLQHKYTTKNISFIFYKFTIYLIETEIANGSQYRFQFLSTHCLWQLSRVWCKCLQENFYLYSQPFWTWSAMIAEVITMKSLWDDEFVTRKSFIIGYFLKYECSLTALFWRVPMID